MRAHDGYFGVLADHAPLIAALQAGELVLTPEGQRLPLYFAAGPGVADIHENEVVALVETAERAEEIDLARAQAAAERARARLAGEQQAEVNTERAVAALERALVRLHLAERLDTHSPT
jgi:F-type H+-transporting ATPase subunit epsilon